MNRAFNGVLIEPVIHLLQLQIVRACKAKCLCATYVRLRFIKEKMDRMDQKKKGQRPIFPPLPFFSVRLPSLFKQCITPAFVIHRESVAQFQEIEPLCYNSRNAQNKNRASSGFHMCYHGCEYFSPKMCMRFRE